MNRRSRQTTSREGRIQIYLRARAQKRWSIHASLHLEETIQQVRGKINNQTTITQVRLDLPEARIRKQRDLHTDTTSHHPPRLTPQLRSGRTGARQNSVYYTYGRLHTYWNLIGRSHYCPTVCVNTQQYSSTTLVSLRFHPLKLKFGMHIKTVTISILLIVLKLRKSEIISGSICI